MPSALFPISYQLRADLFSQLAQMEKAGISPQKAFSLLRMPGSVQSRVQATLSLIGRGLPLSSAGFQAGLFSDFESALIEAACCAGSPEVIYSRLKDRYRKRALHAAKLKARLLRPAALLAASLFIEPLPALASGNLSGWGYLWSASRPLLALACVVWLVTLFPRWLQSGPLTPLRSLLGQAWSSIPFFGSLRARASIRDFFESLALALEAGIPMLDALDPSCRAIEDHAQHHAFLTITPLVRSGSSFFQAASSLPLLKDSPALALIHTGEESGTLPAMLTRFCDMESSDIDSAHQQMADWAPRLAYALIAGCIIHGLLSGS